jgi:hypothetical protein
MANLMTDKEVNAKWPHLTISTINILRRKNKIPYIKIPNMRRFLYSEDAIEKWLDALQQTK